MALQLKFEVNDKATPEIKKLQSQLNSLKVSTKGAETSFGGLNSSLVKVAGGFYALSKSADLAKSFIRQADEVTLLNSQLKLVTNSTKELIKVEKELFSLSQESRQSLSATTNLYARLARASQDLGVSKKDLLTVTEAVNKALIISGASASEASSAITQLSQGLASGVLRGEEFNSITENGTRIAQALSDSLGVTTGQLRAMAMEGKLTSEVVIKALTGESDKIGKEFKKMGITVGQSMQVVENSTMKAIGTINRDFNITTSIAKEMDSFARLLDKNIGDIVNYLQVVKATASIVSNGYESIMATSAIGYLSIAYEFETELESIGNTMIEVTNTTIKELAKTFNEVNEYWGLGLDKVSFTDFKPIDINGDEIKNDIDTLKLKIVELGIKTDESFKIIANGGADASIAIGKIAESGESTKKVLKEIANIKFGDFLNKSYLSMLDSQIELAESTNDWNDNLEGVAGTIQGLGKVFAKFNVDNLKATKAQFQLDEKYQKFTEDNKLNDIELTQLNTQYLKEKSSIDEQNTRNQLDGYGQLSGAMSNMFEEGSREAKALIGIQQALSVVTGITAIANAMASGDGYTAVARGLAVAGTLASFGWAGGGGAGGNNANDSKQASQENITRIEDTNKPILDRLDAQIDLLDSIDRQGSSAISSLNRSAVSYTENIDKAIADAIGNNFMQSISLMYGGSDSVFSAISSSKDLTAENISTYKGGFGVTNPFGNFQTDENLLSSLTVAMSEFAVSIKDTINISNDASDTFKNLYDSITLTNKYADADFSKALSEVNSLLKGDSLTNYLESQISAISELDKAYSLGVQELLLSTDKTKMKEQNDVLKELETLSGTVFKNGVEDAINFLDSIELVGSAMATSTDNIKQFQNIGKSSQQIQEEMFGTFAISMEDLSIRFEDMKGGIDGLNSAELEYLSTNYDAIQVTKENTLAIKKEYEEKRKLLLLDYKSTIQNDILRQYSEEVSRLDSLSRALDGFNSSIDSTIKNLTGVNYSSTSSISEFLKKEKQAKSLLSNADNLTLAEQSKLSSLISDMNSLASNIQSSTFGDKGNITANLISELSGIQRLSGSVSSNLSTEDLISDLIQTSIEYLGADSEIVEWLKSINDTIGGVDFATYEAQKKAQIAYESINHNQTITNSLMSIVRDQYGNIESGSISDIGDITRDFFLNALSTYNLGAGGTATPQSTIDKVTQYSIEELNKWFDSYEKKIGFSGNIVGSLSSTATTPAPAPAPIAPIATTANNSSLLAWITETYGISLQSNDAWAYKNQGKSFSDAKAYLESQYGIAIPSTINGYSSGGYTGNMGVSDVAGVVHGQEYVVNAQTTRDLGLNSQGGTFNEILYFEEKTYNEQSETNDRLEVLERVMFETLRVNKNMYDILLNIQINGMKTI